MMKKFLFWIVLFCVLVPLMISPVVARSETVSYDFTWAETFTTGAGGASPMGAPNFLSVISTSEYPNCTGIKNIYSISSAGGFGADAGYPSITNWQGYATINNIKTYAGTIIATGGTITWTWDSTTNKVTYHLSLPDGLDLRTINSTEGNANVNGKGWNISYVGEAGRGMYGVYIPTWHNMTSQGSPGSGVPRCGLYPAAGYGSYYQGAWLGTQYNDWDVPFNMNIQNDETFPDRIMVTVDRGTSYQFTLKNGAGGTVVAYGIPISLSPMNFTGIVTSPYIFEISDVLGRKYTFLSYGVGNYTVVVNPSSIALGSSTQGLLISPAVTFDAVTHINWRAYYPGSTSPSSLFESGTQNRLDYVKIDGTWFGYNASAGLYNINKGTTMPNPVTIIPEFAGNVTIECTVTITDGTQQAPKAFLMVGQGMGLGNVDLKGIDSANGNLISDVTFSVKNLATSAWSNRTVDGVRTIQYPVGTILYVESTATGYTKATLTRDVLSGNETWTMQMYKGLGSTDINITELNVVVKDYTLLTPIANAGILLSDGQYKITGPSGTQTFNVTNGTSISIDASAAGYNGGRVYITPTGAMYVKVMFLQRTVPTLTPTPYPTPTAIPTPTPVVTVPGYQPITGNFTGFWSPFMNAAVAMGANPGEVGILMALILTFAGLVIGSIGPSMFVGAIVINPLGGEIGAILGIISSVAFNFFPLYLAIIVVVGLILYVSLRVYGVTH